MLITVAVHARNYSRWQDGSCPAVQVTPGGSQGAEERERPDGGCKPIRHFVAFADHKRMGFMLIHAVGSCSAVQVMPGGSQGAEERERQDGSCPGAAAAGPAEFV